MKKWFIALLFVFACLPVVAIKAAPPQTYVHLDYKISNGYYHLVDGTFVASSRWLCSNKIQIHKNIDKLYFSGGQAHFVLFFSNETYIGFYYDDEFVADVTWTAGAEEKILGTYNFGDEFIHMLDVSTSTHIVLQTCRDITGAGLEDYMDEMPITFSNLRKPLIYYPTPADATDNITFGLMPALMIMIVIAGMVGGLIMITKKSKR